jgi:hypothetical protein
MSCSSFLLSPLSHTQLDGPPQVAQFLGTILSGVADRLVIIWSDRTDLSNDSSGNAVVATEGATAAVQWMPDHLWNSSEEAFYRYLYYQCSLSTDQHLSGDLSAQLSKESKQLVLEAAREKILFDFTKTIADFVGTACLSRGYLAPTEVSKKPSSKEKQQETEQDGGTGEMNGDSSSDGRQVQYLSLSL